MSLSQADCVAAMAEHSAGFTQAVRGRLDGDVEHCPGWTVADLVAHVIDVHRFWSTIVEERLQQPPAAEQRPQRPDDDDLVETFAAGAQRLLRVLGEADPQEKVWTWAPAQQDAGFVIRHQVQEMAVHHWDAVNARGGSLAIAPVVAADAVDEFLRFSVSSDSDPGDPLPAPLDGQLLLRSSDTGEEWLLTDGSQPGTATVTKRAATSEAPAVLATASDLLLWLYERVDIEVADVDPDLLNRFRGLTFTD